MKTVYIGILIPSGKCENSKPFLQLLFKVAAETERIQVEKQRGEEKKKTKKLKKETKKTKY